MKKHSSFSLIIILILITLNIPIISSFGGVPLSFPPQNGDWIVSDNTHINDTNLEVNGNLLITNSGKLELTNLSLIMNGNITVEGDFILKNVTIIMNITGNMSFISYHIFIEPTGLMYILDYDKNPSTDDGSIITTALKNGRHTYSMWVKPGAKFRLENSLIQEFGYNFFDQDEIDHTIGILIETDHVLIKNSTINRTMNGILFNSSNRNIIENCTFSVGSEYSSKNYGDNGLIFLDCSKNTITNCRFFEIIRGIFFYSSDNNTVKDCSFKDFVIQIDWTRNTMGIYADKSNNNEFINNSEEKIYMFMYVSNCDHILIKNNTLKGTSTGFYFVSGCVNITLENINITDVFNPINYPQAPPIPAIIFEHNIKEVKITNCSIKSNVTTLSDGVAWLNPSHSEKFYFSNCFINSTGAAIALHGMGNVLFNVVSDVLIKNCSFFGNNHAIVSIYNLNNWNFSNCVFKKFSKNYLYNFWNSIISISNDANYIQFNNCNFVSNDLNDNANGLSISSNYDSLTFNLNLKNCNISNNLEKGIVISNQGQNIGGKLSLDNCTIKNNDKDGIQWISAYGELYLDNSNVTNNKEHGILLQSPFNFKLKVENCTISNNTKNGIKMINSDLNSNIIIKNSKIIENRDDGLEIKNSECKLNLIKSDFIDNQRCGLNLSDCSLEIENCNISNNFNSGFNINSCQGYLLNNKIMFNGFEGIIITNSFDKILMDNNHIISNGLKSDISQIFITKSSPILRNNTFSTSFDSSSRIGLKIFDSNSIRLEDNIFKGSFTESVIDIESSDVILKNNKILMSGTLSRGIFSHGKSSMEIINNTLSATGKYGILISKGISCSLTNNTISKWRYGISLSNISIYMENNLIHDSSYCGIDIRNNAMATLNDNIIRNNMNGIIANGPIILNSNIIRKSTECGIWIKENGEATSFENAIIENDKGILVENGKLNSIGNLIKSNKLGFSLNNVENGIYLDNIIKQNDIGIQAQGSNISIAKCSFMKNNNTISLSSSNCNIYNSSFLDSKRNFILDSSSSCRVLNTDMDNASIDFIDDNSKLDRQWYLNLTIVDTENQSISGAKITIIDKNDKIHYIGHTSIFGSIKWLNLTSMTWSYDEQDSPNLYKVIISKPGFGTTINELNFTENTNLTLTAYKLSELITHFQVEDIPNDQGGAILLTWNSIPILNFGNYNIYVDNEYLPSASSFTPINSSIIDQKTNSLIITEINGQPLQNDETYYFAITIVDNKNREDRKDIVSSNAVIPIDNLSPKTVSNLTVYDTPADNGGSITITWNASSEHDFEYYALYYLTGNIPNDVNISNLSIRRIIYEISNTIVILTGLEDNTLYFFFILVYDINANVNLSFKITGPIIPFDNLPPIIDREICEPNLYHDIIYNSTDRQLFKVFLKTDEDVIYNWFLNGLFLENVSEAYYFLSMSDLALGKHNITVIAQDHSDLIDSLTWNFTIEEVPIKPSQKPGESEQDLLWMVLIFISLLFLILLIFSIRHSFRYNEVRKTLKILPTLANGQAIKLINEKREQRDNYVINKLLDNLPEVYRTRPEKLFFILNILINDDSPELRNNTAKNIAVLLDKYPNNIFSWLRLLQLNGVKPEIFQTISQSSNNTLIKELVNSYYLNLISKNDDDYKASLESSCSVLKKSENLKFGMEMSMLYSTLNDFYKYRTISKISTSKVVIDRIQSLRSWATDIHIPEAIGVFNKMGMVAESLGKYEKVDSVEDKLSYLSLALNFIEDASRITREGVIPPEKEIFLLVLNSWRNIISLNIKELRGRADLVLNLIGKEIVVQNETIKVLLEIENKGRSIAERVLVELVPSNDYLILTPSQELGDIGFKKKKDVILELKPRTTEAFRVEFTVHFGDAEKDEKSISFGDLVTFIDVGTEFQVIPNPYIVGTPIQTGSELFVGRRDLIDFIQKNIRGSLQENIIVLIGHRRTGKTTLLKQLPVYMDKNIIPVYIDVQGIIDPGMDAFFYLLSNEIITAMKNRGFEISQPEFEKFKERPSFFFEYEFLKEVNEKLGDSIIVLMFDEFEELEVKVDSGLLDKNIFSYLRHLMQHTKKLAFIFTGSFKLEDLKTDYWSIMFNIAIYKRISFLSEDETKVLITEPVRNYNMIYDILAIEKIYRLTHGHPYFTQLLCHALVNLHNSDKKNYITIQEVEHELNRIIERGQMHFDFIWERSNLIERLVMTTLTRVLKEEERVTVSSLVNKLSEYDLTVNSNDITKALDVLATKEIVAKILNHTTTYEFKIDLIRIWLETTKHLDQVVEEYRSNS